MGTIIDACQIRGELGRGGFGITYHAYDSAHQKEVALKEFFPLDVSMREVGTTNVRSASPKHEQAFYKNLARFVEEAKTLALFRHRNIVSIQKVISANNTAYLKLSLERGMSMRHWMNSLGRKPTQDELDCILTPLLDALDAVHRNKLLHRDIAPDNILLRALNDPVLLDFGSARPPDRDAQKPLTAIVKEGYSPLEQYTANTGQQGPWTDIYALGATLYEAISGLAPSKAGDRVNNDRILPASSVCSGYYRPAFLNAIDWALSVNPNNRPQSIRHWREMVFSNSLETTTIDSFQKPTGIFAKFAQWLR